MTTAQSDISTLGSAALAKMPLGEFKAGIGGMDGGKLQKFHSLRKLSDQQDRLVRERLAALGLEPAEAPEEQSAAPRSKLPLEMILFGGLCLITPVIGFLAVRLLLG